MKTALFLILCASPAMSQVTWNLRNSGTTEQIYAVAFGKGRFMAVDSRPLLSLDGVTWTRPAWGGESNALTVCFDGTRFIVIGMDHCWISNDGTTATIHPSSGLYFSTTTRSATLNGVTVFSRCSKENGTRTIARMTAGNSARLAATIYPTGNSCEWVVATNNEFIAGAGNVVLASPDGDIWSIRSRTGVNDPLFKDGVLYAGYYRSTDGGATWQGNFNNTIPHLFAAGVYLSRDYDRIKTSADASNWILRETGSTDFLNDVAYGNNIFVAVGGNGRITTSSAVNPPPVVVAPTLAVVPSITLKWNSVAGLWYQVQSSPDMVTWTDTPDLIGGNGTQLVRSYETTAAKRFYRVLVR